MKKWAITGSYTIRYEPLSWGCQCTKVGYQFDFIEIDQNFIFLKLRKTNVHCVLQSRVNILAKTSNFFPLLKQKYANTYPIFSHQYWWKSSWHLSNCANCQKFFHFYTKLGKLKFQIARSARNFSIFSTKLCNKS